MSTLKFPISIDGGDVPPDLVSAVIGVESGGNPNAVSPQGARGKMQIMPGTFKQYAMAGESFDNEEDRTRAAMRKLRDNLQYYGGDKRKAAAAYIGGRGAVRADGSIRDDVADAHGTTPRAYADRVVGLARIDPAKATGKSSFVFPEEWDGREEYAQREKMRDAYGRESQPRRNAFAYANDTMIDIANSAAGLAKAGVDLFAPGSAPSKAIGQFIKSGEESQSDWKKASRRDLQQQLSGASGEFDKAWIYANHAVAGDPLGTGAQIAGNVSPFGVAGNLLGRLGTAAKTYATMALSSGRTAGEVRGNIFEKISGTSDADLMSGSQEYRELRKSMSEEDAKKEVGASIINNITELAVAASVGALGGKYGFEGMMTGATPRFGGRAISGAVGSLAEGTQGATEQLTSNYGVRRVMPNQSLTEDVGLNAVAEGILGVDSPWDGMRGLQRITPPKEFSF